MTGRMVQFNTNGKGARGYLSEPTGKKGPGVIVLQEWWGLVDHIKEICDRFAREGYTAFAPDLYHGESASGPDEAGRLMMALNINQSERDLQGAINFLVQQKSSEGKKVGVIGFCMGGQLAMLAATTSPNVAAVANFYGIHPNVKPDFKKIEASILGIFAEKDTFVTPEAVKQLETSLRDVGKKPQFHSFTGVDHAFF